DYFYVGTGSAAGGLHNPYLKFKYTGNALTAGVDFHLFSLDKNMKKADGSFIEKKLGNELDFLVNYTMNKFTNVELGYSIMNAKNSMAFAKGQAATDAAADAYKKSGNWFYLMLKFTPDFFYTKPVAIRQ
ncbi:MAG: hypothetical protein ABIN97_15735, partial [Ginsengibacter sp.]